MTHYIQTVTGKIPPESIVFCQCHEHLMISNGKSRTVNPALFMDEPGKTLQELKDFRLCGGNAVVDAQPVGCNRMADTLAGLSCAADIYIIASTGFHKMVFYPNQHWIFTADGDRLTDLFIHELTGGMYIECDRSYPRQDICSRAGIIKCALDTVGLDAQYEKLFHAAADASRDTGAPLMVHIEQHSDPIALADFLEKADAGNSRIIFCHMDRACSDLAVHREIARRGIFLEYDTIGRPKYHSDIREAEIFASLAEAGFENQLLFSLDTTRERLKAYSGCAVGLSYIIHSFIPLLKEKGFTDQQIKKISCFNCRRALSIETKES